VDVATFAAHPPATLSVENVSIPALQPCVATVSLRDDGLLTPGTTFVPAPCASPPLRVPAPLLL
jgi:hypothetical protein